MDYKKLIGELSTYYAVSGYEAGLSGHIKNLFQKYCQSVEIDKFYNVIGIKKGISGKKKIMITAHYDEIGLMVKSIDENGFIRFTNVGGIDVKILLAQEVIVHGKKELFGVIGAKPPHLLKPEEFKKAPKMEELYIDLGMSAEKAREQISIGDVISFKAAPVVLGEKRIASKSLDNRASIAALISMMEELSKFDLESDLYFVATVQEEFDVAGASIVSYNLQPDMAVVIDTCHGEIPDGPKDEMFPLGKGPAIGVGPNLHKRLTKRLIEIAVNEDIPYQIDVEAGNTGTEAWFTQVSRRGIPSMLISIPLRYMHTPVEEVQLEDVINTGRLAARFVSNAETEMEGLFCC